MNTFGLYSRREALRTAAAGLVLAPGLALEALAAKAPAPGEKPFCFVVVNDLHYRDARCGPWFERVVAQIRALRPAPAFCMLDGDLSESGTREQLGAVREIFKPLPMPLRTVIGNHDCAENGDRREFEALFGKRANYRFDQNGWQFLALDTTQGPDVYRTRIDPGTLLWVDAALPQVDARRPLIVLTHFPLGRNWLRPLNAKALLARFKRHDLRAVLSGHWHGLTERSAAGTALSTGRCCSWWRNNHDGSDLKGFTLCTVRDGQVSHRFVAVG